MFGCVHQSAIGVIDDHEFLGAQQIMRYDQGAQGVIRDDAAGVADDVGIPPLSVPGCESKDAYPYKLRQPACARDAESVCAIHGCASKFRWRPELRQ